MSSPGDSATRHTMWSIMPRVLMMPSAGWELAMTAGPRPEIAVIRFLLPVCLMAAGSEFFAYFYNVGLNFTAVLVQSVLVFTSFFLGYFISLVFSRLFLPKDAKDFPGSQFGKLLIMGGIGSLAIFEVLINLLPMIDFILEFLPLWTVFIIYKGMQMTVVSPEKQTWAIGAVCIVVICSPIVVEWFLSLFV